MNKNSMEKVTHASCSPINSIYSNLRMKISGKLSEGNLDKLYRCTLCNQCRTARFNRNTREKAVCQSFVMPHLADVNENIKKSGNAYGIDKVTSKDKDEKMETVLFRGCTPTYKAPKILKSVKNLLEKQNIDYSIMDSETCCGNILFNLGDHKSGFKAVRKNVEKFKKLGVKKIITVCPGCYRAFEDYYNGFHGFNAEIHLAVDLINESIDSGEEFIVQDPCHAREKAKVVRKIIKGSKNKGASACCGAGAGLMAYDKQLASHKAKKSLNNPQKIVTYCPLCYINLSSVDQDRAIDIYMLLDEKIKSQG